ncbi:lamin tail domain-containing protein [Pendulispora brunnea]|uniref:Lamin tail domain-containing protein n=1 Tax=Pendulispora brunnea TaxID=2905690 RepID=A0ABZ2K459_9BACT
MRFSRSLPTFAVLVTLVAFAACAASGVTPPLDDDGDGDTGTKPDRGSGPGDPNLADTGTDSQNDTGEGGSFACTPSSGPSQDLVINEIDYDSVGSDEGQEFLEIYNRSAAPRSLDGLEVVFFNGEASGKDYKHIDLTPLGTLPKDGYLVIGTRNIDAGTTAPFLLVDPNTIQNGPRDAVAIMDRATHRVIDSLSYEGALTEPCNLSEGTETTAQDNNDTVGSLIRVPNGSDTNVAGTDWKFTSTPTPGAANPQ